MNNIEENNIEKLLVRALSKEATQEELDMIEQWISLSEENKEIAKQFCWLHTATQAVNTIENIDTASALSKINSRIDSIESNTIHPKVKTKWHITIQRIAACIAIGILGITIHIYIQSHKHTAGTIYISTLDGEIKEVMLPDSSKVWLNKNSGLSYQARFTNTREVHLKGEAYFDVKRDPGKRFVVHTDFGSYIEVKGTQFNINAYPENETMITSLITGSIEMGYLTGNNTPQTIDIRPNERVIYSKKTKEINKEELMSVLADIGWKSPYIILNNSSLENLTNVLKNKYDVNFVIKNKELHKKNFTGQLTEIPLDSVLKILEISSNIKHRKIVKEGRITIELY